MQSRRDFVRTVVASCAVIGIGIPVPAAPVFNMDDYDFNYDPDTGLFWMSRKGDPLKTPVGHEKFVREGLIRHQCEQKEKELEERVRRGELTREEAARIY